MGTGMGTGMGMGMGTLLPPLPLLLLQLRHLRLRVSSQCQTTLHSRPAARKARSRELRERWLWGGYVAG